jgi:hypothetical protein
MAEEDTDVFESETFSVAPSFIKLENSRVVSKETNSSILLVLEQVSIFRLNYSMEDSRVYSRQVAWQDLLEDQYY